LAGYHDLLGDVLCILPLGAFHRLSLDEPHQYGAENNLKFFNFVTVFHLLISVSI